MFLLVPAVWIIMIPVSAPSAPIVAVALTACVDALLFVRAPIVIVSDGMFTAGRARISVSLLGDTALYRRDAAFQARGPALDARAFTLFRGWVDPVVRVELIDPEDPTPYWLISTRRPERLLAAIAAERATKTDDQTSP